MDGGDYNRALGNRVGCSLSGQITLEVKAPGNRDRKAWVAKKARNQCGRDLAGESFRPGVLCGSNSEAGALWRRSSDHGAAPTPELGQWGLTTKHLHTRVGRQVCPSLASWLGGTGLCEFCWAVGLGEEVPSQLFSRLWKM